MEKDNTYIIILNNTCIEIAKYCDISITENKSDILNLDSSKLFLFDYEYLLKKINNKLCDIYYKSDIYRIKYDKEFELQDYEVEDLDLLKDNVYFRKKLVKNINRRNYLLVKLSRTALAQLLAKLCDVSTFSILEVTTATNWSFSGKSKLQRHRIINELLHDDIKMIHALSLSTKTSDEVGEIE